MSVHCSPALSVPFAHNRAEKATVTDFAEQTLLRVASGAYVREAVSTEEVNERRTDAGGQSKQP